MPCNRIFTITASYIAAACLRQQEDHAALKDYVRTRYLNYIRKIYNNAFITSKKSVIKSTIYFSDFCVYVCFSMDVPEEDFSFPLLQKIDIIKINARDTSAILQNKTAHRITSKTIAFPKIKH